MQDLLCTIRDCKVCEDHLPLGARPIIEATKKSKIVLISQAPGRIVHESGIAWNDQSGKKLREWLGVKEETFYKTDNFAVLPMGFCYPGKQSTSTPASTQARVNKNPGSEIAGVPASLISAIVSPAWILETI